MSIAATLEQHLDRQGVNFDVLDHAITYTASRTAQASHVPGRTIAKAVLLKDEDGYILAVLPANNQIRFEDLFELMHRRLYLASEQEAAARFSDCDVGAVPPIGDAYGIDVVMDDDLRELPEVYFEGGDHHSLLLVSGEQFERLMTKSLHGNFSLPA